MTNEYEYEIQGYYAYGWETLTAENTRAEAEATAQTYRENEHGTYRVRKVRV